MSFISKAYRSLKHWSAPSLCHICKQWGVGTVCQACLAQFGHRPPRCQRCALPSPLTLCLDCQHHPPPWQCCAAALPYAHPWRQLIVDFKFHGQTGLAPLWGQLLKPETTIGSLWLSVECVLPVPLSRERLRERGFNQSLLLAKRLRHPGLLPQGLLRLRHTPAQAGLPRHERLQNLTHAIACNPRHLPAIRDRHVLLVDDVMTTGSTLLACTQALLQAGVKRVDVLVLARADGHDTPQSETAY